MELFYSALDAKPPRRTDEKSGPSARICRHHELADDPAARSAR